MNRKCIALYSGGLDSILAVRMSQEQGIEVIPVHFVSPFFGYELMLYPEPFVANHRKLIGVDVRVVDITDDLTDILMDPRHGMGKNMNPCIDCKIMMLRKCGKMLDESGASFVVTGEVLGQRPMSQRKDALNIVERDCDLKGLLLRPLSARLLRETEPEIGGIVDRNRLLDISGRGRKRQVELALELGIAREDIPTPAGGCLLTDEQISCKVRHTLEILKPTRPDRYDLLLDIAGRKFSLGNRTVLVVSRRQQENEVMAGMADGKNVFIKIAEVPGPLAILRGEIDEDSLKTAAGICLRYGKGRGRSDCTAVYGSDPDALDKRISVPLIDEARCRSMQIDLQSQT